MTEEDIDLVLIASENPDKFHKIKDVDAEEIEAACNNHFGHGVDLIEKEGAEKIYEPCKNGRCFGDG